MRSSSLRHSASMRRGPATARIACSTLRNFAEWMLADNVPARLGLQLHKFIWDPAVKGV